MRCVRLKKYYNVTLYLEILFVGSLLQGPESDLYADFLSP